MSDERTPPDVREGVRSGIFAALSHDVERRGGRTARLLAAAGLVGVTGAIGLTLLVAGHPFGHHPAWHVAFFSTVWSGVLVVTLAIAFLGVRTPTLPLARSAFVALLGLGIAGICGVTCPDQHFLAWWSGTGLGSAISQAGGAASSAVCFGIVTSLFVGAVASFAVLGDPRSTPIHPVLPAAMLLVLLAPGVVLQSVGASWGVLASWLAGTGVGAYSGVACGIRARSALH